LHEGFPNTLVEAMAAGRPIVATRVGGIPDAVVDGVTGLLVPPQNPAALAGALSTMMESRDRREAMGASGLSRAKRLFAAKAVVRLLEGHYIDLLRAKGRLPRGFDDVPMSDHRDGTARAAKEAYIANAALPNRME
jgi:glycosyltransferase involved in cell wall biosynthesis